MLFNAVFGFILLVMIAVAVLVLMLIDANLKWHFTTVDKGNTILIRQGGDLKVIWPNVGSHRMSTTEDLSGLRWLIKDDDKNRIMDGFFHGTMPGTLWLQKFLWKRFGIRFVSFLFPNTAVHRFQISRKRLRESADMPKDAPLKSRVVESDESSWVDSILFLVPRPVYVEQIDLAGDSSKINLLVLPVFQLVIPSLPVFYLKGDFFPLLDAAIEATLVDFFATHQVAIDGNDRLIETTFDPEKAKEAKGKGGKNAYRASFITLAHWLKMGKTQSSGPMEQHLRGLNASLGYYKELERVRGSAPANELLAHLEQLTGGKPAETMSAKAAKEIPHGMIPRFGFALTSMRVVAWKPHESSEELSNALLAEQTERYKARGIREEAEGAKAAFSKRGEGEAQRYSDLMKALIAEGTPPAQAADVVRTQVEMEQLKGSGVTTYVRSPSTGVIVPTGSASP